MLPEVADRLQVIDQQISGLVTYLLRRRVLSVPVISRRTEHFRPDPRGSLPRSSGRFIRPRVFPLVEPLLRERLVGWKFCLPE